MSNWNGSYSGNGNNHAPFDYAHNYSQPYQNQSNWRGYPYQNAYVSPVRNRPTSGVHNAYEPAGYSEMNTFYNVPANYVAHSDQGHRTHVQRSSTFPVWSSLTATSEEFVPRAQSSNFHSHVDSNTHVSNRQNFDNRYTDRYEKKINNHRPETRGSYFSDERNNHRPETRGSYFSDERNNHRPETRGSYFSDDRNNHRPETRGSYFSDEKNNPRPLAQTSDFSQEAESDNMSTFPRFTEGNHYRREREEMSPHQENKSSVYPQYKNTKVYTSSRYQNSNSGRNTKFEGQYDYRRNKSSNYSYQGRSGYENQSSNNQPRPLPENRFKSNKDASLSSSNAVQNGLHDDEENQRERLTEQLSRGTLECLVCCDRIRQQDAVWSCDNCHHVLHLKCVKKWAFSSKADGGWCCPACRNMITSIPSEYKCFCGKVTNPDWNRQDVAHSCGEMCGKSRSKKRPDCTHRCTLLCHPGPCPLCIVQVTRKCGCGKTSRVMNCGADPLLCEDTCDKLLNCGVHKCSKKCHTGDCEPCNFQIAQVCYCSKNKREILCDERTSKTEHFTCEDICGKALNCGNHTCEKQCHEGPCDECELTPDKVKYCPCGKMKLTATHNRESCQDPIPTCGKACDKTLTCGQTGNPHLCKQTCHNGTCPPCNLTTFVRCRCGNMDRELPCIELTSRADDARCEKKCTKKRSCGKHRCNQLCCIDLDHLCPLICNHALSCGQHRCEEPCHKGHCRPCWRTSFDELYCECGSSVRYPPIPCGTKPPQCTKPCTRTHPCEHEPLHSCHSLQACPPCTVLTQKHCHGKHELRKTIPCYQQEFSCGRPCNSELPCGRHRCILPCHKGACLKEGQACVQPCTTPRAICGHNCAAPCHDGECPDTACKETIKVTCECGHRTVNRICNDHVKEYQRITTTQLASKIAEMQLGQTVDLGDLLCGPNARKINFKTLECNEECKIIERNRRLAIGLQIRNPDLSAKLTPRYSDFMRQWAKKDPRFCNMVHEKLTELVQLAKQSKQKSRSFSFDPMNRDKRHFIHEYCEHFGCESVAYDQEPKRNIVATAIKEKSWLPSMSLLEVLQRESGQRKIPKPVMNTTATSVQRAMDILPVKYSHAPRSAVATSAAAATPVPAAPKEQPDAEPKEDEIDYFDFTD